MPLNGRVFERLLFIWSSPTVYKGSVYIGLASFGDCPLVQGQFFQLDVTTGKIEHTFDVVPGGCLGGTVWGSPAIDEAKGTVYIGTSESDTCKDTAGEFKNAAHSELEFVELQA
jgi:outer membrane protein assembly factor BamB